MCMLKEVHNTCVVRSRQRSSRSGIGQGFVQGSQPPLSKNDTFSPCKTTLRTPEPSVSSHESLHISVKQEISGIEVAVKHSTKAPHGIPPKHAQPFLSQSGRLNENLALVLLVPLVLFRMKGGHPECPGRFLHVGLCMNVCSRIHEEHIRMMHTGISIIHQSLVAKGPE